MKINKKGFMLVETLVVSTLVSTVLVMLYVQFNNIIGNFNRSFRYNSVDDLYATYNIQKFIMDDYNTSDGVDDKFYINLKNVLSSNLKNGKYNYVDILPNCLGNGENSFQVYNCANFNTITSFYGVKRIIFMYSDFALKKSDYDSLNDANLERFIKNIKIDSSAETQGYRIIVKFDDNRFATLKFTN